MANNTLRSTDELIHRIEIQKSNEDDKFAKIESISFCPIVELCRNVLNSFGSAFAEAKYTNQGVSRSSPKKPGEEWIEDDRFVYTATVNERQLIFMMSINKEKEFKLSLIINGNELHHSLIPVIRCLSDLQEWGFDF